MYVIKKCDSYGYGRNKWEVVHVTPDKEDAISYIREEYRLLLSSDAYLSSSDIESRMDGWGVPKTGQDLWGRKEVGQGLVRFSLARSTSNQYQVVPKRPTAREALDKILN